jgi:hypothetical protein
MRSHSQHYEKLEFDVDYLICVSSIYSSMMLCVQPLLCNDCEIGELTMSLSRQQIGKHVPVTTNAYATIELLLETVFSTQSMQKGNKVDNWGDPVN